ncbi:MAG: minichromosome maintenance protein MCM [Candidatus Aenigmatarchaeota archaeon]
MIAQKCEDFLRKDENLKLLVEACESGSLVIDFNNIDRFDPLLADHLLENPDEVINEFESVIENIDLPEHEKIRVRIRNLPNHKKIRIRNLRAIHLNKLMEIEGIVKAAGEVKPQIYEAIFQCPECGNKIKVEQKGVTLKSPTTCECGRRGIFKLLETKKYDIRWITVEEPYEITTGERPGKINVLLKEDLTTPEFQKRSDPGNQLRITGILREIPKRIQGRLSTRVETFFEANYLEPKEEEFEEVKITEEDKRKIEELSRDPNIYDRLVASIAPGIYGWNEIKEAILLQLFGGVRHEFEDGTYVRGNIHILITGDPSTAKSVLISNVVKALPRGRYVSGKGVTGSGLTTTVTKNELLGGWVLEAGALVLSNKSILSIDEFDKMNKDDQIAMHEAMSLETISIAKASIVATLPAQTSVLAAANPKLGRFDPYESIVDQVMVPETLLSRFDLKFAVRDVPDRTKDEALVDHITKSRMIPEITRPLIDLRLLRKYISYARKTCTDIKLTQEAAEMLKKFYVDMRNEYTGEKTKTVPITLRQFEALIRLAEASAKVRLDSYVRKEDAERAIRLMKFSLQQLGFDIEAERFDIDKLETGITTSQRNKMRIILDIIAELEAKLGKNVPIEDVEAEAEEQGISDAEELIERLKHDGLVFQPRAGYIRRV